MSVEVPDGWAIDEDERRLSPTAAFAPLFVSYRKRPRKERSAPDEREALYGAFLLANGLTQTATGLDRPDAGVPAGVMCLIGDTWCLADSACAWIEIEPQWASWNTFAAGYREWRDARLMVTWNGTWIAEPQTSEYCREARAVFESVEREV